MATVSVALTGSPFVVSPTWTSITSTGGFVGRCGIRRGRQDEFDRTDTGTAQVVLNFHSEDPTAGADLVGRPIKIELTNPVTAGSSVIFRGFVDEMRFEMHPSQEATYVTLECVDALDYLAGIELVYVSGASPAFGYQDPTGVTAGNIFYEDENVNVRIEKALAEANWLSGLQDIFSGNVGLKETVYSPGTSLLTVIHDAADGEFPGVANFYVSKEGIVTFHGRLARFNPADVQYDITTYKAGDGAAIALDSNRAQIRGLVMSRSRKRIINQAYAAPEGIADADIEGQTSSNATSITTYGMHSWSAENLLTEIGYLSTPDNNGLQETLLFADYYVANYKDPRTIVEQVSFRSLRPGDSRAAKTWALMCGVDISDIIDLAVTGPRVSVAEEFYVEGLTYEIEPLNEDYDDVSLTLDLSPTAYYGTNPFE